MHRSSLFCIFSSIKIQCDSLRGKKKKNQRNLKDTQSLPKQKISLYDQKRIAMILLSQELNISFQSPFVSNAVRFCQLSGNVFIISPHTKTAPVWHTSTAKSVHVRAEPSWAPPEPQPSSATAGLLHHTRRLSCSCVSRWKPACYWAGGTRRNSWWEHLGNPGCKGHSRIFLPNVNWAKVSHYR